MLDQFIMSQQRDTEVIRKHLQGADISTAPLWFKNEDGEMILTYAGALFMAEVMQIKRLSADVTVSNMNRDRCPKPCYHAVVTVSRGNQTRAGASSSQDRAISVELAFRNAVGQIIGQGQPTKAAKRSASILPKFIEPELLTHPNIPKPLHGVNPRSVLGQKWWDVQRRKAYAHNRFCCWACGTHKTRALYRKWLEAHEHYEIDYAQGVVRLKRIVALCHPCHQFIHSGRLWMMVVKGETQADHAKAILDRGFSILARYDLKPFWGTRWVQLMLDGHTDKAAYAICQKEGLITEDNEFADWQEWRLILNGKAYRSPFRNMEDWANHYAQR